MVAAVVDEVDVGLLELGDDRGIVFFTRVDAFKDSNLDAFVFEGLFNGAGDAFTVLLFVVQYRNDFRLDVVRDVVASGRALGAVQTDGAEDHLVATSGDFRAGGGRGNHDDAFVFVNVRSRLSGAGAQVPDNILDTVIDHFVGHGNRLFRVAGVIVVNGFKFFAINAALGVDLFDGHFCACELHVAVLSQRPGFRAGNTDLDGVCGK